jgi:hypothetical protein
MARLKASSNKTAAGAQKPHFLTLRLCSINNHFMGDIFDLRIKYLPEDPGIVLIVYLD